MSMNNPNLPSYLWPSNTKPSHIIRIYTRYIKNSIISGGGLNANQSNTFNRLQVLRYMRPNAHPLNYLVNLLLL